MLETRRFLERPKASPKEAGTTKDASSTNREKRPDDTGLVLVEENQSTTECSEGTEGRRNRATASSVPAPRTPNLPCPPDASHSGASQPHFDSLLVFFVSFVVLSLSLPLVDVTSVESLPSVVLSFRSERPSSWSSASAWPVSRRRRFFLAARRSSSTPRPWSGPPQPPRPPCGRVCGGRNLAPVIGSSPVVHSAGSLMVPLSVSGVFGVLIISLAIRLESQSEARRAPPPPRRPDVGVSGHEV